jgi:hypothetical protein
MRSGSISGFPVRYSAATPRYSIALSILIVVALNLAAWAGLGLATTLVF